MSYVLAQVIGVIVAIISLSCVQFKDKRFILAGQFLNNFLFGVSWALLGGLAGAWICLLASVQILVLHFVGKEQTQTAFRRKLVVTAIFASAYITGTCIVFKGWPDLIVCTCAMLFSLSIIQRNASRMRSVMFCNMILWIIYDLALGAYANMITHCLTIISLITAKLRLDRKLRSTQEQTPDNQSEA